MAKLPRVYVALECSGRVQVTGQRMRAGDWERWTLGVRDTREAAKYKPGADGVTRPSHHRRTAQAVLDYWGR